MNRVLLLLLAPLRRWIRALQTPAESLSGAAKFSRAALMVPAFGALLIVLRIHSLLRGRIEVQARTSGGDEFMCHPPDLIQMYIWLFGVWEPDLTHFIKSRLNAGDAFIDVGANIGYFSLLAARSVGENGRVVAIEASPVVHSDLCENIELNSRAKQVRTINQAASDQEGTLNVFAGPSHNIGLTTTVQRRGLSAQGSIKAAPLGALLQPEEVRCAKLIKIDVEGGEDKVMAGMMQVLCESRADLEILIELSPQWWGSPDLRPVDVLKPFFDCGFHAYEIQNNYWPWRYLWPRCTSRPRRIRRVLIERVKRLDVVLARLDVEEL